MTRTYKIAAASMAVLILASAAWMAMPRPSHEIVIKTSPAVQK